ncbi:MAG: DNA polymerase III subunit gamma/tau [Rickettsiales bacterium]|jgi:DNA polymerase-3 subunit gamma/tau|nr:DNA polymerase III subunit gamma/tau [Rickettsiales bacterium]
MSYTVLARKYRSQTFDDLIGQDVLVKTLVAAIDTNRIAHAYIFTGIRGTGKTSAARILAKALNCASSDKPTSKPCGVCENCVAIANGQFIDAVEIDAASHTGVDDVRDNILEAVQYRPTNGRYKIYIIDEVHMLSNSAFNALLKTLEEPPEHVVFILATTEIHKVPITILSRCQRFDLARVSVEVLKKHFLKIAQSENVELSDLASDLIARAADGSVRDGLSILDQAIAQTGGKITDDGVMNMLRRADRQMITDLMRIILSRDVSSALRKVDEVYNAGSDMSLVLADMLDWTHWATRGKIAPTSIVDAPYTPDQKEQMKAITAEVSLNTMSRVWQVMVGAVNELKAAGNPKQNFDMLVIRMINISEIPPVSQLLESTVNSQQSTVNSPQSKGIATAVELADALSADKELLLLAEWNSCEVVDFGFGKIRLCYGGGDKGFVNGLSAWLVKKTGESWEIIPVPSEHKQSVSEEKKEQMKNDPLVADALGLFEGASVVSVK